MDWGNEFLNGEEGGEISRVGGDDNEREEPPGRADQSSGEGPEVETSSSAAANNRHMQAGNNVGKPHTLSDKLSAR